MYTPLQRDYTSLVKPDSGETGIPSFRVIRMPAISKSRSTTLSYIFNYMEESSQFVTAIGFHFAVRANLYSVLNQVLASRYVHCHSWVEDTYIDQIKDKEATDERSLQVSRIKEIYNEAPGQQKFLYGRGSPEIQQRVGVRVVEYRQSE